MGCCGSTNAKKDDKSVSSESDNQSVTQSVEESDGKVHTGCQCDAQDISGQQSLSSDLTSELPLLTIPTDNQSAKCDSFEMDLIGEEVKGQSTQITFKSVVKCLTRPQVIAKQNHNLAQNVTKSDDTSSDSSDIEESADEKTNTKSSPVQYKEWYKTNSYASETSHYFSKLSAESGDISWPSTSATHSLMSSSASSRAKSPVSDTNDRNVSTDLLV